MIRAILWEEAWQMKIVLTVVVVLVVLTLAAFGFISAGIYDVAATTPDKDFVSWVLRRTQRHSVERRSEGIQVPRLDDPERIKAGLVHYQEMCSTCHGAPGIKVSEIGQGLNPYPPELAERSDPDEAAELFWIVKNGIKMTGMPAFGVTHTDEEIWSIVAFVQRMPKLSPEQYQKMVEGAGMAEPAAAAEEHHELHTHTHPPGTPPHED
jgi:mono/diheme cytochrome c family protein